MIQMMEYKLLRLVASKLAMKLARCLHFQTRRCAQDHGHDSLCKGVCWRIKVLSQVSETSQRMTESEDQTVIVIAGKWLAARVFSLFVATSSRTG